MNLIDDEAVDAVHHAVGLAGDHVPLLWRCHDDVSLGDLRFRNTHITRQLSNLHVQILESLLELVDDLRRQRFQRRNIDDLERLTFHVPWTLTGDVDVLADLPQDCKECNVSLTGTSRCRDDHAARLLKGHRVHNRLDLVERLCGREGLPGERWHVGNRD